MEEYIPKSVLVAEIENRINKYTLLQQKPEMSDLQKELQNKIDCLNSIKGYILNAIEMKEVDLGREIEKELETRWRGEYLYTKKFKESAKHFFELGLKAQKEE